MKKIIAAFDGLNYSKSTEMYAIQMARIAGAHLVGIFLDDFTYHSYTLKEANYREMLQRKLEGDEKDRLARSVCAKRFEMACQEAKLTYAVHHDNSLAVQELLHESIYADLIVIDKKESFNKEHDDAPAGFIRFLLANSECPVLVVPSAYKVIEKISLLYDGSPSSVYAIKMFSYLAPDMKTLPAEIITVKEEELDRHLPDHDLMKEFMKRHFPRAVYKILQGDPEDEIIRYLKNRKQNELLVLGAYHRNMVSRWFKTSMADKLMRRLKTPLFIAHH